MKKYAGIWLDHRKAFVVSLVPDQDPLGDEQESVARLESNVEHKVR